jgi:hypothetical protein
MKVRYTSGERAGEITYLGFHEMQAALQARTVEVVNEAVDYDRMTRAELDELAGERGVDISGARNKADVIEALKKSA